MPDPTPPEAPEHGEHLTVLGHQVRVVVRPGTSVRPLVLCNGIGAPLEFLQPFVDALDAQIAVVRFDVPGVGESPLPRLPYRFPGLAILLGKILDQLGHDQVDVLGISWGGGLAQQFALQNPHRCRRLVLVSTGTGTLMIPAGPQILCKMATPRRYRDPDYAVSIAGELYGGRLRTEPELAKQLLHNQPHTGSRRGYLLQLAAGAGWTSLPFLPLIRQPTLILAGTDDPLIPTANATLMSHLLPRPTLHLYDDGHLGLINQATHLAPVIADFLRSPSPRIRSP